MTQATRLRRAAITALGLAVAWFLFLRPSDERSGGADMAPRFVARTLSTPPDERSLDDYADAPLLVNVWATWCDPCREEMPSLERLYRRYRDRGLRVIAISIDDDGQVDLINEFVRDHGLTFDVLHDPRGAIMRQYPVRGVPQTFLVSRDGRIRGTRYVEDWDSEANQRLVDSLLLRAP